MEALVALGLAGNVVQFTHFAGTLISEFKSIRKNGTPDSLPDLKKMVAEVNNQLETIHAALLSDLERSGRTKLRNEDQNLADTAMSCKTAAVEFSRYLGILEPTKESRGIWRTAVSTIRWQIESSKIEKFDTKLNGFRSILNSAALLALRSSEDAKHEIVRQHLQCLQDSVVDGRIRMDQDMEAISETLRQLLKIQPGLDQTREENILGWLNFPQMAWRQNQIERSYKDTFDWVLNEERPHEDWCDLVSYLRHDTSTPYFICGKAGSGKSTLMKYIASHSKTKSYLEDWTAPDQRKLLVNQFFFWNLGTGTQKSCVGLLRALIYPILKEYPELIPAIFPSLYQHWIPGDHDPQYVELKRAWDELVILVAPFLNLALFVDGVDEFEGDHTDLAQFLHSLATPKVKIVVSSRPINEALKTFRGCPTLRLEALTAQDMDILVQGRLVSHEVMAWHREENPEESKEIVTEIKEKANGVFIWVKLVVKHLVKILDDGGTMDDLRNSLQSLPGDLYELYGRMLNRIPAEYRQQAVEIFMLLQAWQSTVSQDSFYTKTLYFAMRPPPESLRLPIGIRKHQKMIHDQIAARVRSRCCGLVEVGEENGSINYIHRTVAEFLKKSELVPEFSKVADTDMYMRLLSACLSVVKTTFQISTYLDAFIVLYRRVSSHSVEGTTNDYVMELEKTMTQCRGKTSRGSNLPLHWSVCLSDRESVEVDMGRSSGPLYPHGLETLFESASIFTFAARVCFLHYVESVSYDNKVSPVLFTLEAWTPTIWSDRYRYYDGTPTEPVIPLAMRRDTLLALVKSPEASEVLDGILLVMSHENKTLQNDMAVLIAIGLTTSRDPQRLMQNGLFEHYSRADVVACLCCSDDTRNRDLGIKISTSEYEIRQGGAPLTLQSAGMQTQYRWRPYEQLGSIDVRYYRARQDRDRMFHKVEPADFEADVQFVVSTA